MIVLVVGASLLPASSLPKPSFSGIDKVEHLLAYMALSSFAMMLFARRGMRWGIAVALVVLGALVEVAPATLTASRAADPADFLANTLGVALGAWAGSGWLAWTLPRLDAVLAQRG